MLSIERPLKEPFERPKPKISWNLFRGKASSAVPDRGPACQVNQLLDALTASQPGCDEARQRYDHDGHDDASGSEGLTYSRLGHDQAQSGDHYGRNHRDQCGPGMSEHQYGARHERRQAGWSDRAVWPQNHSTITSPEHTAA